MRVYVYVCVSQRVRAKETDGGNESEEGLQVWFRGQAQLMNPSAVYFTRIASVEFPFGSGSVGGGSTGGEGGALPPVRIC